MKIDPPSQSVMFGDIRAIELAKPAKKTPTGHKLHAAMIRANGQGPADTTCKGCRHLIRSGGHSKSFLKCNLTLMTNGAASDWRAKWLACGRYETKETKDDSK